MLGLAGSPEYSEQSAELIWSTALNYWALIEGAARVRRDTGKDCWSPMTPNITSQPSYFQELDSPVATAAFWCLNILGSSAFDDFPDGRVLSQCSLSLTDLVPSGGHVTKNQNQLRQNWVATGQPLAMFKTCTVDELCLHYGTLWCTLQLTNCSICSLWRPVKKCPQCRVYFNKSENSGYLIIGWTRLSQGPCEFTFCPQLPLTTRGFPLYSTSQLFLFILLPQLLLLPQHILLPSSSATTRATTAATSPPKQGSKLSQFYNSDTFFTSWRL